MSEEVLERYFDLWISGKTQDQICRILRKEQADILGGPIRTRTIKRFKDKMNELAPYFLFYCRDRIRKETRAGLASGIDPEIMPLTEERKKEFLTHIEGGLDYATACQLMGVPLPTLTEVWFKEDAVFAARAKYAAEMQNAEVQRALYKRAVGFEYTEVSETVAKPVDNGDDEDDEETGQRPARRSALAYNTVTVTKKHSAGNVNAQKLWLINRDPDNWTIDGSNPAKNNKGKILEALEAISKISDEELEDMDKE